MAGSKIKIKLSGGLHEVNNMMMACDRVINRAGDVIHSGICGKTTDALSDCLSQDTECEEGEHSKCRMKRLSSH